MRTKLLVTALLSFACTPEPALDDEAETESSSSSESEAGSESTSGGSEPEDSGFVPTFDTPGPPVCDLYMQDCPAGEKCVPTSSGERWETVACVPVMGDRQPGEPCTWSGFVESLDDCDATSFCWNTVDVDGELIGECLAFCQGTPDTPECPPDTTCSICSGSCVPLCIPPCDPLVQDCGEGLGCYWTNVYFSCSVTSGDIPTGEPCGFINDCAAGNLCVDGTSQPSCAGAACCTQYCDLDLGDDDCADQPETICSPFFELGMAPPDRADIGVCVLPS